MNVQVTPASLTEKSILRNLLELYLYELSEYDGSEVGECGLYGYDYLEHYWTEEGRHPFLIRVGGRLTGFALVNRHTRLTHDETTRSMAEFFVLKKYRRRGVGEAAALQILRAFPGWWEVTELAENLPAQRFWRNVISRFTNDSYEEILLEDERWRGPVQVFASPGEHGQNHAEERKP